MMINSAKLCKLLFAAILVSSLIPSDAQTPQQKCFSTAVQNDIYRSLHDTIKKHVIQCESGSKHVEVLGMGKMLKFDDFNPGVTTTPQPGSLFSQFGRLPLSVVERALPLVDKIFPAESLIKPVAINTTGHSLLRDYNFDSLSSTFKYVLEQMMVTPKNFTNDEMLRAKYYLQELVPNPESVVDASASSLPRLILYDYYRAHYLEESGKRDTEIESKRLKLSQQQFKEWGHKELPPLVSNAEAAYMKWQIFGYKTEVENQLQYFDIGNQEDRLMRSRALFRSAARFSEDDPHFKVYPMSFIPENWHNVLKSKVDQSADELRYLKSMYQAQYALLKASRNELHNITSKDIQYTLKKINSSLENLGATVKNAIDKMMQYQIECFTQVNASACEIITSGQTAFRFIVDKIAEHYEQAAYLQAILNSRNESIIVIGDKLDEMAREMDALDSRIETAERERIDKDTEVVANINFDVKTCPTAWGKTLFTYESDHTVLDAVTCSGKVAVDVGNNTMVPYCLDEKIPVNTSERLLWNLASCSVDLQTKSFHRYKDFIMLMNTAPSKVSAALTKVNIKRAWFDEAIFRDWEHFTLKKGRGLVSPGPLEPARHFHEVIRNGQYLMPQYTTSFILANDIKIFFPGLGIVNDSDTDNQTNNAINTLMRYAYAPNLEGGYGPFSFVPAEGTKKDVHNFRVERINGGIQLTIPGAQIVAYVSTVISRFPADQPPPPKAKECIEHPASKAKPASSHEQSSRRRRRRDVDDFEGETAPVDMMELARSLFSQELSESDSYLHRNGFIKPIGEGIQKLMDGVTEAKENFEQLIQTITSPGKEYNMLFTTEPPISANESLSTVTQPLFTSK